MNLGKAIAVVVALASAGCATAAQQKAQQIQAVSQLASAEFKQCVYRVRDKPEYALLIPHSVDLSTGQPTMQQLIDETVPTAEEAKLLIARHDDALPCRKRFVDQLSTTVPAFADIMLMEMANADAIAALLVQRKITWAEATRQEQKLAGDARSKLLSAGREIDIQLGAEHQVELARRQAASNALMQWSLDQQMINSINRPKLTTCNAMGTFVNCVSH